MQLCTQCVDSFTMISHRIRYPRAADTPYLTSLHQVLAAPKIFEQLYRSIRY
jgi:hypothetical protein